MAATSLKLPDDLKRRVAELVEGSNRTIHSFMVEAIERAAQREELRKRFGEEAELSERETERTGKVLDVNEAFDYLEAKAEGQRAKRPRAKAWRRSS